MNDPPTQPLAKVLGTCANPSFTISSEKLFQKGMNNKEEHLGSTLLLAVCLVSLGCVPTRSGHKIPWLISPAAMPRIPLHSSQSTRFPKMFKSDLGGKKKVARKRGNDLRGSGFFLSKWPMRKLKLLLPQSHLKTTTKPCQVAPGQELIPKAFI